MRTAQLTLTLKHKGILCTSGVLICQKIIITNRHNIKLRGDASYHFNCNINYFSSDAFFFIVRITNPNAPSVVAPRTTVGIATPVRIA